MKYLNQYLIEKFKLNSRTINKKYKELSKEDIRELTSYGYEELPRIDTKSDLTFHKQLARLICINNFDKLDKDLYRRLHAYTDDDEPDKVLKDFLIKFIEENK